MNVTNNVSAQRSELNNVSSAPEPKSVSQSSTASSSTAATSTNTKSDAASISSASGALSAALNSSDVRSEKVSPIKSAIDAGTYSVPSTAVADKVITSLLK